MKNLVALIVVGLLAPFASAEWFRFSIGGGWEHFKKIAYTYEINKHKPMWEVIFYADHRHGLRNFALVHEEIPFCGSPGLRIESKVDDLVTPVVVVGVLDEFVYIDDPEHWYYTLSGANHWVVKIADTCGNTFDMEFDVSGTPDLYPPGLGDSFTSPSVPSRARYTWSAKNLSARW